MKASKAKSAIAMKPQTWRKERNRNQFVTFQCSICEFILLSTNPLHRHTVNGWILSNQIKWNRIFGSNFRLGWDRTKKHEIRIVSYAHPCCGGTFISQAANRGRYEKPIWAVHQRELVLASFYLTELHFSHLNMIKDTLKFQILLNAT